jgi:tetratricopeptide (TPR) repeat protein
MNMQDAAESMPQRYVVGAAGKYSAGDFRFKGGLDLLLGESEGFKYALGLEGGWKNIVFLRAGLDDSRMSFGAGAGYFGARLDYSYTLDDFGSGLSKFTLSYAFGQSLKEQDESRKSSLMQEVKKQVEKDLISKMAQKASVLVESAKALYAQKNYEAAYQQVLKALEWQKIQPIMNLKNEIAQAAAQQYYNQATEEYNAGNNLEAMDRFSETSKYMPGYKDSKKYIAEIKQKLGISGDADRVFASGVDFYINKHYNEAIKEWEKALINDPENATIKLYISKARTAMQAKHDGKALTAEQEKQIDELYMSAVEAYTSGDLKKAVSMLEQVLKIDPEKVKALRDMEKAKAEMMELEKRGIK